MPKVVFESGQTVEFDKMPTPEDIADAEQQLGLSNKSVKTPGLFGTSFGKDTKAMSIARIPSEVAQGVSKAMMDANEPQTQSVPLNAALRIPQTLASIGAEGVANTISPESVAVAGALKGAQMFASPIKAAGRFVGNGLERLSGLSYDTPGVLARTTNNPGLPFAKGTEAVGQMYEAAKGQNQIGNEFKDVLDKKEALKIAFQKATLGILTPEEALEARKELSRVKNTLTGESFRSLRTLFDGIAKIKFAGADKAFTEALDAENMSNVLPLNKSGTPSIMKTLMASGGPIGGLIGGAGASNPVTWAAAPLLSPWVQAMGASGVGVVRNAMAPLIQNPEIGAAIPSAYDKTKQALQAIFGARQ